jgi:hypothetical protein
LDIELRGREAVVFAQNRLREIRVDRISWITEYEDPNTHERWIMDQLYPEAQGGGVPRLRKVVEA